MNIFIPQPSEPPPPPDVAAQLTLILEGLRRAAAAHASRYWIHAPIVWLLWPYLGRVAKRFEALVARVRSGRLRPRRIPTVPPPPQAPRTPGPPKNRLPSMQGWLLVMLRHEAGGVASQLRLLLTGPEMAAVFAAAPEQAGRILRPLCRMLAITPQPDLPPALFALPIRPPRMARSAAPPDPQSLSELFAPLDGNTILPVGSPKPA